MYGTYDKFGRLERPLLALCNPGATYTDQQCLTDILGFLNGVESDEFILRFNDVSELSFRVYKTVFAYNPIDTIAHVDIEDQGRLYNEIQKQRLIFAENIGFFVITEVKEGVEGDELYKDVRTESVDIELKNTIVPHIPERAYTLCMDPNPPIPVIPKPGILDLCVEVLQSWSVGHIDESLYYRKRAFSDVDPLRDCFSFLMDDVQDAFECVIVFDAFSRTINAYDKKALHMETSCVLSSGDIVQSSTISDDSELICTALTVYGKDGLSIAGVNPIGTNTVYNFDHFLPWMSVELRTRVGQWQDYIKSQTESFRAWNIELFGVVSDLSICQSEISRINICLSIYRRCRDNIESSQNPDIITDYNKVIEEAGGEQISYNDDISVLLSEIDALISEYESQLQTAESELDTITSEANRLRGLIADIVNAASFDNYFTPSQYNELKKYMFNKAYCDEYCGVFDYMNDSERFEQMIALYDRAVENLGTMCRPFKSYNITNDGFVFTSEFEHITAALTPGCRVKVVLPSQNNTILREADEVYYDLIVVSITINYDDKSLSLETVEHVERDDGDYVVLTERRSAKRMINSISKKIASGTAMKRVIRESIPTIPPPPIDLMVDAAYPVGSLYYSAIPILPNRIDKVGTWQPISQRPHDYVWERIN